jgi:hypothetical protein
VELKFNISVQARRLPRKKSAMTTSLRTRLAATNTTAEKQQKSCHAISILNQAKLAHPQNQDTGSRNPYFAGSADAGISAVLPTIHSVSISFSSSHFENIPSLSGANFLLVDFYRLCAGPTAA